MHRPETCTLPSGLEETKKRKELATVGKSEVSS